MKKILLVLLLFAAPAFAQMRIDAAGNVDLTMPAMSAVGYSQWFDLTNYGITVHRLNYRVVGTPAAFTLTLECTNTGSDTATSVLGTGVTPTGDAIVATNTPCTRVRAHLVSITGKGTIFLLYHGSYASAGGAGSDVNLADIAGTAPDIGTGAAGSGTLRVAVASDSTVKAVGSVAVGAAVGAVAPVGVGGIDGSGNRRSILLDALGDVQNGVPDGLDVAQGAVGDAAATAGGTGSISAKLRLATSQLNTLATGAFTDLCEGLAMTNKHYLSAGTTDKSQVKATGGTLCSIRARNAAATASYLRCVNALSASTTVGTTAVIYDMIIPPGGGFVDPKINLPFTTALTCYLVTGKAETDATSVVATDVSYTMEFQ